MLFFFFRCSVVVGAIAALTALWVLSLEVPSLHGTAVYTPDIIKCYIALLSIRGPLPLRPPSIYGSGLVYYRWHDLPCPFPSLLQPAGHSNERRYQKHPINPDSIFVSSLSSFIYIFRHLRRIGLPYSESLVDRTLLEVSGTVLTARLALEFGLACNLAGGTHHAHKHFGSG